MSYILQRENSRFNDKLRGFFGIGWHPIDKLNKNILRDIL